MIFARINGDAASITTVIRTRFGGPPTITAGSTRLRRWCAYCLKLTPDKNLSLCSGCRQVGYCELPDEFILTQMHRSRREPLLVKASCQVLHWKAEHNKECKRHQRQAGEKKRQAAVAVVAGVGGEGGRAGGGRNGAAGGGSGGNKKGGKSGGGRR